MLGLIGEKIGMTQYFSENGDLLPVSVIKVEPNLVVKKRISDKDGYDALLLGIKDLKEKKINKPYRGQFSEKVVPKKILKEFRIKDAAPYEIGQEFTVKEVEGVDFVDITATSKGKGFQGVMKRHGFSGGPAGHGSKFHRQNGSTGQCSYPSRVFKGLKRAGRMGSDKVTIQNLKVVKVDIDNNLILVKGAIPGNNKGIVFIRKACKK